MCIDGHPKCRELILKSFQVTFNYIRFCRKKLNFLNYVNTLLRKKPISQLYVNLCQLVDSYKADIDFEKSVFIYDDGCHFDAYKNQEHRANNVPGVTDIIAKIKVFIDKYHQSNHTACGDEYNIRKIVDDMYKWV
eukprot:65899_1